MERFTNYQSADKTEWLNNTAGSPFFHYPDSFLALIPSYNQNKHFKTRQANKLQTL